MSISPPSKLPRVSGKRKKAYTRTADKEVSPPAKKTCECTTSPDIVCLSGPQPAEPTWYHTHCYNPLTVEQQRSMCRELGLQFVCANGCTAGGLHVPLRHPTSVHRIPGDGNCLFRALSYVITGSERQHFSLHRAIIRHMRSTPACTRLVGCTIKEYLEETQMHCNYKWGTDREIFVLAHMVVVNIANYNINDEYYHFHTPGVIGGDAYPDDNSGPSIYIQYTGDHFNVVLSQD